MVELPTVKLSHWRLRSAVREGCVSVSSLGLGLLLAFRLAEDRGFDIQVAGVSLLTAVAFLGSAIGAYESWRRESRMAPTNEPAGIRALLIPLHTAVCRAAGCDDQERDVVRVALHKVHWDRKGISPCALSQVTRYIGGRGGSVGRKFSIHAGIIGRCARTGEVQWASRDLGLADSEYAEQLVSQWGYTWDEAQRRRGDRQCWLAIPLLDDDGANGRVVAVVYVDSSIADLGASEPVKDAAFLHTQTLANYLRVEYSK